MLTLERVTREDLTLFINACFACTGQREFYGTAQDQRVSVAFLHAYVLGNYRRLYARCLAVGVNDFNKAEIIRNLLATGRDTPPDFRAEENALVTAALRSLPPQRAWKLVTRLRQDRVNNRRTRALLRAYAHGQADLTFHAVKYRRHVRAAAIHARVPLPGELPAFLFDMTRRRFETPLLESFRQARYSMEAVYDLPFSVAEGLAAKHGVRRDVFLRRIEPKLTERERLRLQGASGGRVEVRPERLSLTALASFVLSRSVPDRVTKREQFEAWLDAAVRRVLTEHGRLPLPAGRVAAVLDCSYSSSGSREKHLRPLAVTFAAHRLLRASAGAYRAFWTREPTDDLLVTPRGQTNLADRLLDALEWGARTVIVVSDAVENDPPGAFAAVARAASRVVDGVTVLHFNPVFDADLLSVRGFGGDIPTVGLRNAEDLPAALGFARFTAGQTTLQELEAYLASRVRLLLQRHGKKAE